MKKNDWELMVKKAVKRHHRQISAEHSNKVHVKALRKYISIPITIGIVASLLIYKLYGVDQLVSTILSWFVGVTIVATLVAALSKH